MAADRGYIGPLGDDFPAIFPIALGLIFFFGAITLTYDYYNAKQNTATLMAANTALAKSVRMELQLSADSWGATCISVEKAKANYGVRAKLELLDFREGIFERMDSIDNIGITSINPCVDHKDDGGNELPLEGDFFISMTYPVLVPSGTHSEIATLRVTTWT